MAPDEPLGERGAWAADHVTGDGEDQSDPPQDVESTARVWKDGGPSSKRGEQPR